ncbi:hypothetical protein E2C01_046101 [Portunus trituberculatus]|uniref:Uncharacterized protein n=1 Tax=Portunus trituberculatus TaxID=210409 RepID=A0A5B7G4X3_PORTR|nr:hypothetical protein [Portunus trituberculatus]
MCPSIEAVNSASEYISSNKAQDTESSTVFQFRIKRPPNSEPSTTLFQQVQSLNFVNEKQYLRRYFIRRIITALICRAIN